MKKLLLLMLITPLIGFGQSSEIILNGAVSVENNQIKNIAEPTDNNDAVTKDYLLDMIASLQEQIDLLQRLTGNGTLIDQEGNSYPYLTYGDQVWTVKNAEMVTYRDGTPIPQVTDATEWANLTTGAWCYYDNDPTKGKLYNWYAVAGIHDNDENTPNKEFAPEGWQVPSKNDWTTLENYLIANGYSYDQTTTGNGIAKSMASTIGWENSEELGAVGNDQSLNNSSGFNALPVGLRDYIDGSLFISEGYILSFWSSTIGEDSDEVGVDGVWCIDIESDYSSLRFDAFSMKWGHSVRFIKNELSPSPLTSNQQVFQSHQSNKINLNPNKPQRTRNRIIRKGR